MIAASFQVKLTLQGPVMTQSTTQGQFGIDAAMARSGGHFYLPGTLIKGLIGEAWQELACVDPTFGTLRRRWLGEISSVQNLPARGALFFQDLADSTTGADGARTQYRVEIDEERGSVKHGHYLVIEAPYRSGQPAVFEGTFWLLSESRQEAEEAHTGVETALRWVMSAGAERSIGFGRVLHGECSPLVCEAWRGSPAPLPHEAFDLELRFTQPVCFARRRVADNLFESERWVTGAALKGALATLLGFDKNRWPNLREQLHAIRFTHAFPAMDGATRPVYPPESLVKIGEEFRDALFHKEAVAKDGIVPAFDVDWKESDRTALWKAFGWPAVDRELRVRTAIDGEVRRAAAAELFAYQMIVPDGLCWRARVELAGVPSDVRAAVAGELDDALSQGLFALGKTKARATVERKPAAFEAVKARGELVAIVLQTPALLCDPSRHLAPNGQTGSADRDAMWAEYQDVWRDLSGGSLELENYFQRLSLAGGGYMLHRFQKPNPYRPYLLTDAGSVFLLRVKDARGAEEHLDRWQDRGLGLSPAVRRFYFLEGIAEQLWWQHCPFLPENGFGEIVVDGHRTPREGVEVWDV